MKKSMLSIMLSLCLLLAVGCSQNEPAKSQTESLTIVTTFYPMYDFTKQVVGEEANISMLITGETEPHDYEPSAKDIAKIQDADIFIYNSKEMESWVPAVLESIDTSNVTIVEASQGIELLENQEIDHDHDHDHQVDPHVWLDPLLAKQEVTTIANALSLKQPEKAEVFTKNLTAFSSQLDELHQSFTTRFNKAINRDIVTQHAAFGYLANRYNFHQVAITGISPDQEPSPAELAAIQDFVKEKDVKVIYTEELASPKIAKTIAEATNAKVLTLNTLEGLSKKDQAAGRDYVSVMSDNLAALVETIN